MDIDKEIAKVREKMARTDVKCGTCGDIVKCIDLEQHVREKHFDDSY